MHWFNWKLLMNMSIVGLAACLFGYDTSFIAPQLSLPAFIQKYQGDSVGSAFTARNLSLIVSVPIVGSAAGGLLAAVPLQAHFGRKRAFLIAYGSCCIPGSILQLFAPNLAALVVGRIWNAFGVAVLLATCPLYMVDLAPVHVRARSIGIIVFLNMSVSVLATVTVWGAEKMHGRRQYEIPLALQAGLAVVFFCLSLLLMESPSWLIGRGRVNEARKILLSLRHNNEELVCAEIAALQLAHISLEEQSAEIKWWYMFRPENLKRTFASSMLMSLSQVGGQILVLGYSTVLLVQSGVGKPFDITILIYTMQLLGGSIGPLLMDRIGRRPVCLVGFTILILLNVVAGGLACAGLKTQAELKALAAVFILFAFTNGVSFQSIVFLAPAEIPTAKLREATIVYGECWSYVSSTIITFAIPQLISPTAANLGAKVAFVFAGCLLITIILTYFFLPETRGRTTAEMDEMYNAGVPMRKWKKYKTTMSTAQNIREKSQE
ncbi:general substrate transporter [Lipomyces starkeyi]